MFSLNNLALGILPLMASVVSAQSGIEWDGVTGYDPAECDVPDFATVTGGGSAEGGGYFCASKWKQGTAIKALKFYAMKDLVSGIKITFTDDDYLEFGSLVSDDESDPNRMAEIVIDPTEDKFTSLTLWDVGNNGDGGDGMAIGRVQASIESGASISVGNDSEGDDTPISIDLGQSGILFGISGRQGYGLDQLNFYFAREKITGLSIVDMELSPSIEEINQKASNAERGFTIESLDEVHHVNNLETNTEVWMRGEKQISESTSLTKTSSDTFHLGMGFDFKASFGIPLVGETEITMKTDMFWEHKEETSNTVTETETQTKVWQQNAVIKPGQAIRCFAWAFEGQPVDVMWTATTRIEFGDGTLLEYPSEGGYNSVEFTRVNTECRLEKPSEAVQAANKGARVIEAKGQNQLHGNATMNALWTREERLRMARRSITIE